MFLDKKYQTKQHPKPKKLRLWRISYDVEKKKDKEHEHFVNDDPTKFDHDKMEDLAKEALKKFKSLQ